MNAPSMTRMERITRRAALEDMRAARLTVDETDAPIVDVFGDALASDEDMAYLRAYLVGLPYIRIHHARAI